MKYPKKIIQVWIQTENINRKDLEPSSGICFIFMIIKNKKSFSLIAKETFKNPKIIFTSGKIPSFKMAVQEFKELVDDKSKLGKKVWISYKTNKIYKVYPTKIIFYEKEGKGKSIMLPIFATKKEKNINKMKNYFWEKIEWKLIENMGWKETDLKF